MYNVGNGVEQSYENAIEWYEKAAKQGVPQANTALGFKYLFGTSGKIDVPKARHYFQLACNAGEQVSCENLTAKPPEIIVQENCPFQSSCILE